MRIEKEAYVKFMEVSKPLSKPVRIASGVFLLSLWMLAALSYPPPASPTPPSWEGIVGVNMPELKKEAAKRLSPEDAEKLEKHLQTEGRLPLHKVRPPYTPVTIRFDGSDLAKLTKPYLERGEVDRVKGFLGALNKKRVFTGESRIFPAQGQGYSGPSIAEFSLELAESREYRVLMSFRPAAVGKGETKYPGRTVSYSTGVHAQ
jgi:hypothetical protein